MHEITTHDWDIKSWSNGGILREPCEVCKQIEPLMTIYFEWENMREKTIESEEKSICLYCFGDFLFKNGGSLRNLKRQMAKK